MTRKVLFIYNARSGQGKIKAFLSDIIDVMIRTGWEVTIYSTQEQEDAVSKCMSEAMRFDRIICSGGDGTLDEVVTGLMRVEADIPIGYIPAGTTNDFACSIGINKGMLEAAAIAAGEHLFPCDIGRFNENYFVYVAAFGLFTEASYSTSQEMKNMIGHAAYILEGAKQLADIPSYAITAEHDGETVSGEFIFGMVSNTTQIGGVKGLIMEDVGLNDGLFEVTLIRFPRNPIELSEILAFFASLTRDTETVLSFQTREIRFISEQRIPWTLDGEFGGEHNEAVIKNLSKAVNILVE